jgi:uncharacterized membrane protein
MQEFISDVSKQSFPITDKVTGKYITGSLYDFIRSEHPDFTKESLLSISELNGLRQKYISSCLMKDNEQLLKLQKDFTKSLHKLKSLTKTVEETDFSDLTLGQRVADKVATFGGSWTFIISFGFVITLWISINSWLLSIKPFDPYPFILLNLLLSCLAALQAPVIMMSQNRQEEKDRERAKKDFLINLKSELEIRLLHEKVDYLIMHQQQDLLEIQKIQVEMMDSIIQKIEKINQTSNP